MKRETPFKLAAKNTLKVTERDLKGDKLLLNTFQGSHDLHKELTKAFANTKPKLTGSQLKSMQNTQQKLQMRNEQQLLAQEVAALDNFKAGVTREKTKALVENIKLRRREKHLQAMSEFKEDLQDYKQNLFSVYSSLENDLTQVLSIRENQLNEYLSSLKPEYMLTRDKGLLHEIAQEVSEYKKSIIEKIKQSQDELERINNDRKNGVENKCQYLQYKIAQIAFVLQDEAKAIADKEKESIQQLENQTYTKTKGKLGEIESKSNEMISNIEKRSADLQKQWKQLNEQHAIDIYLTQSSEIEYQWPEERHSLYKQIIELQNANSQQKLKLIMNLAKEHPDTITKANIDKWNEHLKTVNQHFNEKLDAIVKSLTEEAERTEGKNKIRFEDLRKELNYIENRNPEEVNQLITEKCQANFNRNNDNAKELLKKMINYVEDADEKQNSALEKLSVFLGELGNRTDDFVKRWGASLQDYEVQKAKILDEDDEIVEKLTNELTALKQQLREALHHIKLEQVQKACFEKIDELQKAFRNTHQKNKDLAAKRPETINKFMNEFEAKIAESFSLFDQSKRAQLVEKAKKECEQLATKRYEQQDKKKQEEELIAAEESKKKGGKPAPSKPKDPKKALAEMEERKKVLMQQIGLRQIEEVKTGSGSVWLAYRSLVQICTQFYKGEHSEGDHLGEEITNYRGDSLVSKKALISAKQMSKELEILRNNFFAKLGEKKVRVLEEADIIDGRFLEQSLTHLDVRLREHYPQKGKLEAEIGVVRSGEITNHKKQYEKHVRTCKEKMDLQTEKFNFLLQKCLQFIKTHNTDQKSVKEELTQGKTLSDYQGCYRKAHQNYKSFLRQTQQIGKELLRLSSSEVQAILNHNEEFIKHCKLLSDGGQFSPSEMEWYKNMMTEINTQISQQKDKRAERTKEVQDHIEKRSKEIIQQFDKDYNLLIEDLSAKQGTGKKYGRPKRIAQEKLRFQMNKCEQAQISIDKQIDAFLDICSKGAPHFPEKPSFNLWRQKLMTLQSCIVRYARHIEGIVSPCKARVMPRVTYLDGVADALLAAEEQQQDKKKIVEELLELGPLGEQKEDKIFMKFLQDIEKIIGDEARSIYTGDKAKYINGNDKLPDFLRLYIQNMRKNAEEFRQESIRSLRESCGKLAAIANNIIQLYFHSIQTYFGGSQSSIFSKRRSQLRNLIGKHEQQRSKHLQQLRPNLSNPKCQQQLKQLDDTEKKRYLNEVAQLKEIAKKFQDEHFNNASQLLYTVLNNYEFLILYFDSIYLFQDFIKVTGDDVQEKIHLDAKRLLLMKQKGINIDANSQRNIKKKWQAVTCTLFNFGEKKFVMTTKSQEQPKEKDKKGGKKDSKAPKQQQQVQLTPDQSKSIQTIKTWRQKSVFTNRDDTLTAFSKEYHHCLDQFTNEVAIAFKENDSFKLKWETIAKTLYVS